MRDEKGKSDSFGCGFWSGKTVGGQQGSEGSADDAKGVVWGGESQRKKGGRDGKG